MKCDKFCNWHCSTMDCPNVQYSYVFNAMPYDPGDVGMTRIKCKDCKYNNDHCTCDDCYFQDTKECPKKGTNGG